MRLANGIVIDKEATFGALKFSALRREVHLQNEDGSVSEEIDIVNIPLHFFFTKSFKLLALMYHSIVFV